MSQRKLIYISTPFSKKQALISVFFILFCGRGKPRPQSFFLTLMLSATAVVPAAVTTAAALIAPAGIAAAAEEKNENQNDPQTVAAAKTVIASHKMCLLFKLRDAFRPSAQSILCRGCKKVPPCFEGGTQILFMLQSKGSCVGA